MINKRASCLFLALCLASTVFSHDADTVIPENESSVTPFNEELVQSVTDPKHPLSQAVLATESEKVASSAKEPVKQEIKFDHYINDTPPPSADVPPAPGVMMLQNGVDRFDGAFSSWPIFKWTWHKYTNAVGDAFADEGHEREIWVGGATHMVPDQLFVSGPFLQCEEASNAKVEVVSSTSEMDRMEAESRTLGFEQSASVEAGAGPVGLGGEMSSNMQSGSSQESKDFESASKKGQTRSAFASIESKQYQAALVDPTSLHPIFKKAVKILENVPELNDDILRTFYNKFGTDYLTSTQLGGKVTQQTTAAEQSKSSVTNSQLAQQSEKSFGATFGASMGPVGGSVGASGSKTQSTASGQTDGSEQMAGTETSAALFKGGTPSGDYHEWCESTVENPAIVQFFTDSIFNLVASVMKKTELATAMQRYLLQRQKDIASCPDGQTWDKRTGKCIAGACSAGKYKGTIKVAKTELSPIEVQFMQLEKEHAEELTMLQGKSKEGEAAANAASGKTATQSSSAYGGVASRAIDGKTSGRYGDNSCTHTNKQSNAWWRVDLGKAMKVSKVTVYNRSDCCSERLNGFKVKVGNNADWSKNAQCGSTGPTMKGRTSYSTTCNLQGKYVSVVNPANTYFSLCEVVVTAGPPPPPPVTYVEEEACVPCPPGTYMGGPQDKECTPCKAGTYSEEGATMCTMCDPGTTSDDESGNCPYLDGSYNIISSNNRCSLAVTKKGLGDNDLPDSDRWAYFDCASTTRKVQVKHIEDDKYQITASGLYLGGSTGGDGDKYGSYAWGIWKNSPQDVKLKPAGNGMYNLIYNEHFSLVTNKAGDQEKACLDGSRRRKGSEKCPWASWKQGSSSVSYTVQLKSTMG